MHTGTSEKKSAIGIYWKGMIKILNFREKIFVSLLFILMGISLAIWVGSFYYRLTKPVPEQGGEYVEGMVGQPLYINPLLSQTSESDADLSYLIYNGLLAYDENGKLKNDLAESYEISDDGREYTVHLKKNITWHDGKPLTADDVVFTVGILQNPAYKSPLRQSWDGSDARKNDDYSVTFFLKIPYAGFLDNLTVGILPKHIWENIAPEKFSLADYNLHPIGSGPFVFNDFQKDASGNILTVHLSSFRNYHKGAPYISKMTFNFYPDEESMIKAYNEKEIKSMGSISPEEIKSLKNIKSTNLNKFIMPRYFSVFFNQTKNKALADDAVRKALNMATDKNKIVADVLDGNGMALSSPFFRDEFFDKNSSLAFNLDEANKMLDDAGWKMDQTDQVRKKNGVPLSFELVTTDWPELSKTADILKQQWKKIGAEVNVKSISGSELQQNYIRTREYDGLLFGQAVNFFSPDDYSFWHSSRKNDPYLNLSLFDNKDADGLLEALRQENDSDKRLEDYQKLSDIFNNENPAVFLYSPYYIYPTNNYVQGMGTKRIVSPSDRFANVEKWYINTARVWKGWN